MLQDLTKRYFEAFQNKNHSQIQNLLAPNVSLMDWENHAIGIKNVLSVYSEIFKSFKDIKVKVVNLFEHDFTIIGELTIYLDDLSPIRVVDIIEFQDLKIINIRAYRC